MGCLIVGLTLSVSAHFIISFIWRSQVRQRWKRRQQLRLQRKAAKAAQKLHNTEAAE
jgi:uncharacterized protein (DUF2062 family)